MQLFELLEAKPFEVLPAVMIKRIKTLIADHDWEADEVAKGDRSGGNTASSVHAVLRNADKSIDAEFVGSKNKRAGTIELKNAGKTVDKKTFDHSDFDSFIHALEILVRK